MQTSPPAGEVDYRSLTLAVTFESTEFLKCFSDVLVMDDKVIEADEAFGICLSSNTSAVTIPKSPNVTVVIQNDDGRFHLLPVKMVSFLFNSNVISLGEESNCPVYYIMTPMWVLGGANFLLPTGEAH